MCSHKHNLCDRRGILWVATRPVQLLGSFPGSTESMRPVGRPIDPKDRTTFPQGRTVTLHGGQACKGSRFGVCRRNGILYTATASREGATRPTASSLDATPSSMDATAPSLDATAMVASRATQRPQSIPFRYMQVSQHPLFPVSFPSASRQLPVSFPDIGQLPGRFLWGPRHPKSQSVTVSSSVGACAVAEAPCTDAALIGVRFGFKGTRCQKATTRMNSVGLGRRRKGIPRFTYSAYSIPRVIYPVQHGHIPFYR